MALALAAAEQTLILVAAIPGQSLSCRPPM